MKYKTSDIVYIVGEPSRTWLIFKVSDGQYYHSGPEPHNFHKVYDTPIDRVDGDDEVRLYTSSLREILE